jgi:hypothetical protein
MIPFEFPEDEIDGVAPGYPIAVPELAEADVGNAPLISVKDFSGSPAPTK